MKKQSYKEPSVTVIVLANADVITLSSELEYDPIEEEEENGK